MSMSSSEIDSQVRPPFRLNRFPTGIWVRVRFLLTGNKARRESREK